MKTFPVRRLRDRCGMNWRELWRAYCVFMPDPAQGILHILAAGRYSRWNRWVLARSRASSLSL
jgi:hypothetical protein